MIKHSIRKFAIILMIGVANPAISNVESAPLFKWKVSKVLPTANANFSLLTNSEGTFFLGGLRSKQNVASLEPSASVFYKGIDGNWTPKMPMPIPRHSFASGLIDGKLYVAGGLSHQTHAISIVDVYDPLTDRWERKSESMPIPRYGLTSQVYRGKLYTIGGSSELYAKADSVLEVYEPNGDKWVRRADMPTPRLGLTSVIFEGKIYAIGGWVTSANSFSDRDQALGAVEVYDPVRDVWQKKQNMPTPRAWLSAVVVNQKIYVLGGRSSDNKILNTIESYDPITDTWKKESALPIEIEGHSSILNTNEIFVAGGRSCISNCLHKNVYYSRNLVSPKPQLTSFLLDKQFEKIWEDENVKPSKISSNSEFLRRVTLDVIGRLPSPKEIDKFNSHQNREKLIDELLNDEQFPKYWSERIASQIFGYGEGNYGHEKNATAAFIAQELTNNESYSEIVKKIISANPTPHLGANKSSAGAFSGYYASQTRNPKRMEDMVNNIGRAFLGTQLHCAQCHDSHIDKRTSQDDYYGLVAFFGGFNVVNGKLVDTSKITYQPERYTKRLSPKFIDGRTPSLNEPNRAAFARFVSESDDFSLAFANNIWSEFFGLPLLAPSNSVGVTSESDIHPVLLELSNKVRADNFDLRKAIRLIANSKTYQLSSRNNKAKMPNNLFSSQIVRPMNPEQMFYALSSATDLRSAYEQENLPEDVKYIIRYSHGFEFVKQLFINSITSTADFETPNSHYEYTANISQVLKLMDFNSIFYAGTKIKNNGRLREILATDQSPEIVTKRMYIYTLSRSPTSSEITKTLNYLNNQDSLEKGYEGLFWALLSTNEFFFNH